MPADVLAGCGPGASEGSSRGRESNRGGGAKQGGSFPPTTSRVVKLSGQQRLSGTRREDCGVPKHRAWFQMIFSWKAGEVFAATLAPQRRRRRTTKRRARRRPPPPPSPRRRDQRSGERTRSGSSARSMTCWPWPSSCWTSSRRSTPRRRSKPCFSSTTTTCSAACSRR